MKPTTITDLPPWTPANEPTAAFAAGLLALAAALATAFAARIAAPPFGALVALGLAANAALLALLETRVSHRGALGRLGWGLLVAGWIGFAVLLLHTPLAYPDLLRALVTGLVALGAALHLVDWRALSSGSTPAVVLSLCFSTAAIAVVWFGGSLAIAASPLQALVTAAALDLCAAGSAWLERAWLEHVKRRGAPPGVLMPQVRYVALRRT